MSIESLVPVLQTSVGPVILISGVGLLLLSMTNRFGRVIDRSRSMAGELNAAGAEGRDNVLAQARILVRRARLLRGAIVLASLSVLLVAVLIITLFVATLLHLPGGASAVVVLFVLSMVCLIGSLLLFLGDLNQSLHALWLELPVEARGTRAAAAQPRA